jgi:preprotein translocase subunit SecD
MTLKYRVIAIFLILIGLGLGYFNYASETEQEGVWSNFPFRLGLDLAGGSHLVYSADVSQIPEGEVNQAMRALRDVIERRVNVFGVSDPVVEVERG